MGKFLRSHFDFGHRLACCHAPGEIGNVSGEIASSVFDDYGVAHGIQPADLRPDYLRIRFTVSGAQSFLQILINFTCRQLPKFFIAFSCLGMWNLQFSGSKLGISTAEVEALRHWRQGLQPQPPESPTHDVGVW